MFRTRTRVVSAVALSSALVLTAGAFVPSQAATRANVEFWFWGTSPQNQDVMKKVLVDGFNKSQTKCTLKVTYDNAVDNNVAVALSADQGPDVVYGSGPSFAAAYAAQGKLADMTPYAKKYGWDKRVLTAMYKAGTVKGKLYSLPNSLNDIGVFYNVQVLKDLGVKPPKTIAQLESIMDKAIAKGLYGSVTGNKGWKPVNQNYASVFLTQVAGGKAVYNALQGKIDWTSPVIAAAVDKSAQWYKKGYFSGKDYSNLNFVESMGLLAQGKAPFFVGPTLAFQFAANFFNDANGNSANLGFVPFPATSASLPYPYYTLGTTASLSINAASKNKACAAAVINHMMQAKFGEQMTAVWPGYWAVPVKDFKADPKKFKGIARPFVTAINAMIRGVDQGNYGFFIGTFFPPATATKWTDIDSVWMGQLTTAEFLTQVQTAFDSEKAQGLVPPVPAPKK